MSLAVDGSRSPRLGAGVARLGDILAGERARWALWLAPAVGLGVALFFSLPGPPPGWSLPAVLAAIVLCGAAGLWRPACWPLALGLAAVLLGFAAAEGRLQRVAAPVLQREHGPARVEGQVLAVEAGTLGVRLLLRPTAIARLPPAAWPRRVRVSVVAAGPALAAGDWVRLTARLRPPPGPAAPGAFDFARRAYFQGIGATGFAYGAAARIAPPAQPPVAATPWRRAALWLSGLRQHMAARIRAALPGVRGEVAAALIVGERRGIPESVLAAMRDSGLAHLLAISGLHLGLVSGTIFVLLRGGLALWPRVALAYPIKKWAAVAAGIGAFAYLLLAGATIPTQRAFLMVMPVLLAVLLDRSALSMRLVAWAAVVILLLAPESLLSASFQLSFAAVTALVAGYEALRTARQRRLQRGDERPRLPRAGLYLGGVALSSVIANLATAPFAVHHFNRLALYGLAANLAAVPLTALWIMPWALLAVLLMPFGLEAWALVPMGWGIALLLGVAEGVAGWPGATLLLPSLSPAALALLVAGGLWLCLWQRPWRLAGVPAMLLALTLLPAPPAPDLLVSADGRLVAARGPDGRLALSSRRRAGFVAEQWLRRNVQREAAPWPQAGAGEPAWLRCDPLGCLYRRDGRTAALVADAAAFAEDCRRAGLVVAAIPAPPACRGTAAVIDLWALRAGGAHAARLTPAGLRIETANERRGRWPWVVPGG